MPPVTPSSENESLTVRIPGALKARLLELASANDVPAGAYVAEALEQWFASRSSVPAPPPGIEQLLAALSPSLAQLSELVQPDDVAASGVELGAPMLIEWNPRGQPEPMDDGEITIREGPVEFDGMILRAVERGGIIRAEVWEADGWKRGGSLEDILWGTPLTPEEVERLG